MKPLPDYRAGSVTVGRADDQNARAAELRRLLGRHAAGAAALEEAAGGGLLLKTPPEPFIWARVTGGVNPYSWEWLRPAALGAWEAPVPGRGGTAALHPAYEVGGNAGIPDGTVVKLRRGLARVTAAGLMSQEWLFRHCCQSPQAFVEDVPSGFRSGSGSGFGVDGTGRNYFLAPCCPALLLPPVLTFTVTDLGGNFEFGCLLRCLIGKSYPLYGLTLPDGTVQGYYLLLRPIYFPGAVPPEYTDPYGCLGFYDEMIVELLCSLGGDGTRHLQLLVHYINALGGTTLNFTMAVEFNLSFCDLPFSLSGTGTLDPPGLCSPLSFTVTE